MNIVVIIVANLLPLIGAIWFDWKAFDYLAMYWLENWVVLAIMLAKVKTLVAHGAQWGNTGGFPPAMDLFSVCAGYVAFTTFHGFAVFVVLPGLVSQDRSVLDPALSFLDIVVNRIVTTFTSEPGLLLGFLVLAISHVIAYVRDFLFKREHGTLTVHAMMKSTMQRVTSMHVAIVLGGLAATFLGLGTLFPALAVLVILKTLFEVGLMSWLLGDRQPTSAPT